MSESRCLSRPRGRRHARDPPRPARPARRRSQSLDVIAEAKDGREAIDLAEQHQPDVIVLDVSMPVMDGFEALPHITIGAPGSTIVMYTAHGSEENRARALSLGAHHFVEKGGDPTGIVDTVEESCARARRPCGALMAPSSTRRAASSRARRCARPPRRRGAPRASGSARRPSRRCRTRAAAPPASASARTSRSSSRARRARRCREVVAAMPSPRANARASSAVVGSGSTRDGSCSA